jgi:DNA end-binding protein Ku
MVTIPVELHSATSDNEIHFHQLHSICHTRIKYQKYCPTHKAVVENDEIQRGFEVSKGKYVMITDEELDALPLPTKHTIEITAFVKAEQIDAMYIDTPYYLEPHESGQKPLALLIEALEKKKVVGLGKVALRNREALCLIRPSTQSVVLETLRWPDEIRKPARTVPKNAEVDPKQLKMAENLIDLLADDFDPAAYHDEYREALKKLIAEKSKGHEVKSEAPSEPTQVIDLMEALKASVEAATRGKKKSG